MGRCTFCNIETNEIVNDNIGKKSYLCDKCQDEFKKCEICEGHFLEEDLNENDICNYCNENYD